jgi:oxygen-independent coproporphyrinogen-3 oxidase
VLSLYIHTPFCNQKCAYCSFSSFPVDQLKDQEKMLDDYTKAILDELKDYQKKLGKQEIKTIYFG